MFDRRELTVIELSLHNRLNFLQENCDVVPAAVEKATEVEELIRKVVSL